MTSAAQIAANIANAQHSTGPTTFEGKARSAENARKFGFYSKQAVLLTDEDHFHFDCICETFEFDLQPQTTVEHTLVELIILATWNIQRSNRVEAKLARSEGVDPLLSTSKTIDRIHAFRHRTERSFLKLINEFRRLKSETPPVKPILQNEPNSPAPLQFIPGQYTRQKSTPYVRPNAKIGRNDLCPCKSGRKYKQCCSQNEDLQTSAPTATYSPSSGF